MKKIKKGIVKTKWFFAKLLYGKRHAVTEGLESDLIDMKLSRSKSKKGKHVKLYKPFRFSHSEVGDYTYITENSTLGYTKMGKFCSVGPNLISGWGAHPTNGISTHPMFYSTKKQNGMTLTASDKFDELRPITIGNDVFIGMNVTILDGVTIGDGAVIGAGAVVSKDIPPYAIAVGCPIEIKGYRFDQETIDKLLEMKWWDFDENQLKEVEENFFNCEAWVRDFKNKNN